MVGWLDYLTDARFAIVWSAMPPFGMGVWAYWKYQLDRRDKRVEANDTREMTREERRSRELDKQQDTMTTEQWRMLTEVRRDNDDLRARLAERTKEADRWWFLARFWHGTAHDMLRWGRDVRHDLTVAMQWIKAANLRYPDLGMPVTIQIPDRPEIPAGLEDVQEK